MRLKYDFHQILYFKILYYYYIFIKTINKNYIEPKLINDDDL